jgi:hypothetical protein
MRLKAVHAALLCGALAVAGCSGGDGPTESGPPAGFTFLGTWELQVEAAMNCWNAFEARIEITQASLTPGTNGVSQLMNPEGWWYTAAPGPDNPSTLSGSLNSTTGTFTLRLWKDNQANKRGQFAGSAQTLTRMSGTFTDPDGAFRTTQGTQPCSANAHALKD